MPFAVTPVTIEPGGGQDRQTQKGPADRSTGPFFLPES